MHRIIIITLSGLLFLVGCSEDRKTFENYTQTLVKQTERTRQVESQAELHILKTTIASFKAMEGRNPQSLDELVEKKYINNLPAPPRGKQFSYDPATGEVKLEG